jgi:hypothetical protein
MAQKVALFAPHGDIIEPKIAPTQSLVRSRGLGCAELAVVDGRHGDVVGAKQTHGVAGSAVDQIV